MKNQNKRIIVVSPADSFFTMPHVRAFQAAGFECIAFDNRAGKFYSSQNLRRLIRNFPWLRIIKTIDINSTNSKLLKLVKDYKPWLVFAVKAENITPETVKKIRESGVLTALFYIDLIDHWEHIKQVAPVYDYFFNQDHIVLRKLRDELNLKNSFYMAHSAEPLSDPFSAREDRYNISFIGTYNTELYPNREKYLSAIKDLGLHLWGTDGWAKTALKNNFHGRSAGDQRFDVYSHSKIVVDINWDILPAEGLSNRPFEVTGSGAMFMTDYVREDIKRAYTENKEVVLFKDEKELREKVKYYLEHETERNIIARAGYAKTVAKHTYTERIRQLLNTIKNTGEYLYKS